MNYTALNTFHQNIKDWGGVLTTADFANLIGESDPLRVNSKLQAFLKARILKRFIKGIYLGEKFSSELLVQKLYPESYLSLGTALARSLIIGSIPEKTFYAVKPGRSRIFDNGELRIQFFSISKALFFGWIQNGASRIATPEKAFLDLLYYYQKGFQPSFHIYSDLNIQLLNQEKIFEFLEQYKNPKYRMFVKNFLKNYGNS